MLANLLASPSGFDEAIGEIGVTRAVRSGLGLTNEHNEQDHQGRDWHAIIQYKFNISYGTTFRSPFVRFIDFQ